MRLTLLSGLLYIGLAIAQDILTPTGLMGEEFFPWPEFAHDTGTRNVWTNAKRIQSGMALNKPRKLYNAGAKRSVAAPSSAAGGGRTYRLVNCNAGGDGAGPSYYVSGSIQQMADACAAFQSQQSGRSGVFALWPGGNTCYTGVTMPPYNPVDCTSTDAIIADYAPY